jgi:hypothetical protein
MSTPPDTLSQMIEALTEESSKVRRRTHANTAYTALRQMREAQPPANAEEAEQRGYRRGLLVAIAILKEARQEHERPLETANVGKAYTVINGVMNYGQFLCSDAESRIGHEAFVMERLKKETP